jgi:putative alpha-1,2-mannosidase
LKIDAVNQSDKNVYVKNVKVNGKFLNRKYVTYAELMAGGTIAFEMSDKPAS